MSWQWRDRVDDDCAISINSSTYSNNVGYRGRTTRSAPSIDAASGKEARLGLCLIVTVRQRQSSSRRDCPIDIGDNTMAPQEQQQRQRAIEQPALPRLINRRSYPPPDAPQADTPSLLHDDTHRIRRRIIHLFGFLFHLFLHRNRRHHASRKLGSRRHPRGEIQHG